MTSQPGKKQLQYTYYPISHEVKTTRHEIWSVNRIQQEKYFHSKVMQKMSQGDYNHAQNSF